MKPGYPLGLVLQQPDRRQGGGGVGRRDSDAVHEARRRVLQILDHSPTTGNVSAATAERLTQGAHPEVDVLGIHAEVFADAASVGSQDAGRVGLVDHEEGLVALLYLDEPG